MKRSQTKIELQTKTTLKYRWCYNFLIMKTYRYTGLFLSAEGHEYTITVSCNGTIQAFFLLTADAIRSSRHYQLRTITDEEGRITRVDDILHVGKLLN